MADSGAAVRRPDPGAVTRLVERIVAAEMPEELERFQAEGASGVSAACEGRLAAPGEIPPEERDYGFDAMLALNVVSLIIGTVGTLAQLYRTLRRKPGSSALQRVWADELEQAGLERAQAEKIAARFTGDLEGLLPARGE